MHIVWGLIGFVLAYLLLRYRGKVYDFTGPWGFAERYLGAGGTGTAMVLVAILIFLIAITILLGKLNVLFSGTVGRFF